MGIQGVNLDVVRGVKERIVISESHIDDPSPFVDGILNKGSDKMSVVLDFVNLPDDVVAKAQSVQYFIKAWKASACRKK
jgi:hypothetical protein